MPLSHFCHLHRSPSYITGWNLVYTQKDGKGRENLIVALNKPDDLQDAPPQYRFLFVAKYWLFYFYFHPLVSVFVSHLLTSIKARPHKHVKHFWHVICTTEPHSLQPSVRIQVLPEILRRKSISTPGKSLLLGRFRWMFRTTPFPNSLSFSYIVY